MKKNSVLVACDSYTPNHMLDMLMARLGTKNDAALARALEVPPSTISKVRNRQMVVNSTLLLAAHEATEFSIRELRDMLGDTDAPYWLGSLGDRKGVNKMPMFVERIGPYGQAESVARV